LLINGSLQYDAAVMKGIAINKAPSNKFVGHHAVLVYSELNTGNTTYRVILRGANLVSIGLMLQGFGKPVDHLSRSTLYLSYYSLVLTSTAILFSL
jgi:phosphate acetyltransferase